LTISARGSEDIAMMHNDKAAYYIASGMGEFPGHSAENRRSLHCVKLGRDDKGRAALPWRAASDRRRFSSPSVGQRPMTPPVEMTILFEDRLRVSRRNRKSQRQQNVWSNLDILMDHCMVGPT
jgi:hypothetical protein